MVSSTLMNSKSKYCVTDSSIHDDVMGSDHCPISIRLVAGSKSHEEEEKSELKVIEQVDKTKA